LSVSEALREHGVVVDFRPPNIIRGCPSPFYVSFEDVWNVVEYLYEVLGEGEYERFSERGNDVT
jgi:kynureninase